MTTLKAAQSELRQNGISLTKTDGEYRVALKGTRRDDTYSNAYFTSDLHDALMTGLAMARTAGTLVTRVERTEAELGSGFAPSPVVAEAQAFVVRQAVNEALLSELAHNDQPTVIKSLAHLRSLLKAFGVDVYRAREGYYYFVSEAAGVGNGIYVFSCVGTNWSLWLREAQDHFSR